MIKNTIKALSITMILIYPILGNAEPGPLQLHYESPAAWQSNWTSNEALPIGNGTMAGMVYGGVGEEVLQFNEDTVWMGSPNDYSNPGAGEYLDDIRNAIWEGRGEDAYNQYVEDNFMSVPIRQSPYVGAGELRLTFPHSGETNYKRILDLETATAIVEYDADGVTYRRETFASYPDKVIVMRLTGSEAGSVSLEYTYDTLHTDNNISVDGTDLILDAKVNDDPNDRRQQTSSVEFQARVSVEADGGQVTAGSDSIEVSGADSVTLKLHVATNFVRFDDLSADPETRAVAALNDVSGESFDELYTRHLDDYQELFNRVTLDLGTTDAANLPTDERLDKLNQELEAVKDEQKNGEIEEYTNKFTFNDPQLVTLNFQMARYLMISGSRPGSQPLNLQGKWNNELEPSWESKMTLNINQEMNYWAAEVTNLAETHKPMIDMVRDLSDSGATVADVHYNADGWMVHHNTDLWRGAAPINNPGGMWPSGGAWLSMHLWWHYQYSDDESILNEIYPLMKGAAEFFEDFLVMDPRDPSDEYAAWGNEGHPQWGEYLLTNPSHSPEQPNKALDDNGNLVAGPMVDNQLIRALFGYVIEASETLGVDSDFRATLEDMRSKLPPNMIGKHGQLQEWLEDVDEPENPVIGGHRHLSHMIDVFPGEGIHPIYEPEFAEAAEVVLDWKGDPSNNTSWSRAWKMNLRTALLDGDHAFMILQDIMGRSHTDNMTFSNKGNGRENQIDGNFGALMGTAQFLLQSRRGEIHLLPALPAKLASGNVSGLRAKGNFEVDIAWKDNALTEAKIRSGGGNPCVIRSAVPLQVSLTASGDPVEVTTEGENLYSFETVENYEYTLEPVSREWAGYPVDDQGFVNTGTLMGWVYVNQAPYIWSYPLSQWMYITESNFRENGSTWAFVMRSSAGSN